MADKKALKKPSLIFKIRRYCKHNTIKVAFVALLSCLVIGSCLLTYGLVYYNSAQRQSYVVTGVKAMIDGNFHKAQSILLRAVKKKDAPEAYPFLAWISARTGNFNKALEYSRECAKYKNLYGAYEIMGNLALLGYGNAQGAGSAIFFYQEALKGYSPEYIQKYKPMLKFLERSIPYCMNVQDYIRIVDESLKEGSKVANLYRGDIDFLGLEHDLSPRSAMNYWVNAKNRGIIEAQSRIAGMLWHGYGVNRNIKKALELYEDSAKKDEPIANYSLGLIKFRQDKKTSYAEGLRHMKNAAKKNYGPALTAVGVMAYTHNYDRDPKIVNAVADIFKQAYDCGDPTGGILYALMLNAGIGVPEDYTAGLSLLYDIKNINEDAVVGLIKYYTYTNNPNHKAIFEQVVELCKRIYFGDLVFIEGAPEAKAYFENKEKNLTYFKTCAEDKTLNDEYHVLTMGKNYVYKLEDPTIVQIESVPLFYLDIYKILVMYNPTTGASPFTPKMVLRINATVPRLPQEYDKFNLKLDSIERKF